MEQTPNQSPNAGMKFCKHCGKQIPVDAVICTNCGRQVESTQQAAQPSIVINNTNQNTNNVGGMGMMGTPKSKMVALALCLFGGFFGLHKFYEGKILTGIIYFFTGGLFFIGVILDFLSLLGKPDPYYVGR